MLEAIRESKKLRHPYYRMLELSPEELKTKTESMSRAEIIDWLCWNDHNGVYKDEQSLAEFGNTITKEEAIKIMFSQIYDTSKLQIFCGT